MAGGGSGGGGQPTTNTTYSTNIPEYAQPYVETMLGTAQQQVYNYNDKGEPTDMKPYTPYSEDPNAYVAGFSPMQQQSFQGAANMGVTPETGMAAGMAGAAGMGALNTQYNPMMAYGQNFGQGAADYYMNPYQQNVTDIAKREAARQSGIQGTQQQAQATQAGAFGGARDAIILANRWVTSKRQVQTQRLQTPSNSSMQTKPGRWRLSKQTLANNSLALTWVCKGFRPV